MPRVSFQKETLIQRDFTNSEHLTMEICPNKHNNVLLNKRKFIECGHTFWLRSSTVPVAPLGLAECLCHALASIIYFVRRQRQAGCYSALARTKQYHGSTTSDGTSPFVPVSGATARKNMLFTNNASSGGNMPPCCCVPWQRESLP